MRQVTINICLLTVLSLVTLNLSVSAQNITVNNNLAFGDVFPGVPKQITKYTAGSAAEFQISGTAGSEVSLIFTLPTYLAKNGYNLQIIFFENSCAVDSSASPDQSSPGQDNLDPWHEITYRLGSNGLTVWLGGMVVPGMIQSAGDYSGTITLTVAYTGN